MSRPSDHVSAGTEGYEPRDAVRRVTTLNPLLRLWRGLWAWLTSMRTAIILLLLLAIAAVPGSLVPQRTSDPNGVTTWYNDHPDLAPLLESLQLFDVYSSWWFSAIYLLLFVSLVGCIVPRVDHHLKALRAKPPRTPARLARLDAYATIRLDSRWVGKEGELIDGARRILREGRYRTEIYETGGGDRRALSVSAERGYLRETGNLVFHIAMLGVILSAGILSGFNWHGQRVLVEGQTFVNGLVSYSSFNPSRFFSPDQLPPYSLTLDRLDVTYETDNPNAIGTPLDYTANVTVREPGGDPQAATVRVNSPLRLEGTDVYLLANGYAPTVVVRDPQGREVFRDSVIFIPQDSNLTSTGVIKVPDGLAEQVGLMGFFYPTAVQNESGAFTSAHQDLNDPLLTLNVYTGDLGLDTGVPVSVFRLDTSGLTQIAGRDLDVKPLQLRPGDTVDLPNGLGTISLEPEVRRYASFDVHRDYTRIPVAVFTVLTIGGLMLSLLVPRRRMWVKASRDGDGVLLEYAGLARGEDAQLARAVNALVDTQAAELVSWKADFSPTGGPS